MPVEIEDLVRFALRERPRLIAYATVILADEHAAEDVFQDVLIIAMQKADEIASPEHLKGWLRLAARNRSLDVRRTRRNHASVLDPSVLDVLENSWSKLDESDTSARVEALRKCIDQLPPKARKVLELRYVQGLTGQQLADRLGRKLSTAYVAVSRVHRTLHECIQNRLDCPGKQEDAPSR
ncbi:MAG: sigma-70 family RNA polymerase sigma factor [Planctomycetota bacterium]